MHSIKDKPRITQHINEKLAIQESYKQNCANLLFLTIITTIG